MKTLKILVPYATGHETTSIRTLLFNNMIPILKKRVNVKIQRILYQPEKLKTIPVINSDIITLDLHNYDNAIDVLKKEKPDIIYANPYTGFIDFAFVSAAKFLNIPVFSILNYEHSSNSSFDILKYHGRNFLSNYVEVEVFENKKSFMRRGKFILYKFSFLIKTIYSLQLGFIKNTKTIMMFMKLLLFPSKTLDSRLAVTKHYLRNKIQEKELLELGFDPNSLLVTGHPMFDESFKKIRSNRNLDINKIKILFAPDPFYESGMWTKKQHELILTQIITTIIKTNFSLKIKLHPSSTVLSEYEPLIHSIDSNIEIFQKGSLEDFLDDADIILSYSSQSTGLVYSLIHKKPIIICNFFDFPDNKLLDAGLALECKDPSQLVELILKSINFDNLYEQKRNNYIKKYFYKDDGNASDRICDDLLNLILKF